MVIETGFADRHDTRTLRQLAQRRNHIFARFLDIGRMNADDGKDVRIFLRQLDRAPAAFHRRADRDDARDTGLGGATKHVIEIGREIRIIEMRVSLDEHWIADSDSDWKTAIGHAFTDSLQSASESAIATIRSPCSPRSVRRRRRP